MKLLKIHLQNFRLHADTVLDFPNGMTGIIGPNESGKSTIPEAIRWALFGAKALRKTVKSLRWKMAPARHPATVVLNFEVGGKGYMLERSEGKAALTEYQVADKPSEGSWKKIAEGIDAVDGFVPKLLGMDLQEFDTTYMCGQKDIGRLATMKGTARKQFILKVLGVGRIDDGLKKCREKKNALKTEAEGMEAGLGEKPTSALATAKEELRLAEVCANAADTSKAAAALVSESADEAFSTVDHKKEEYTQLMARSKQISDNIDHLALSIIKEEKELAVATEALLRSKELAPQVTDLPELMDQRRLFEQAQTQQQERQRVELELEELRQRRSPIEAEIEELDEAIDGYGPDIDNLDILKGAMESLAEDHHKSGAALAAVRVELSKAIKSHAALDGLGEDGACPTCNRELGNAYGYVMKKISSMITNLKSGIEQGTKANDADQQAWLDSKKAFEAADAKLKEYDSALSRQADLRTQRDQMKTDIDAKQKALGELEAVKFDQAEYDLLIAQITEVQKLHDEKTAADAKAERIPDLTTGIAGFQVNRDGHREEKVKVAVKIRELDFYPDAWDKAKHHQDECTASLQVATTELVAAETKVDSCVVAAQKATVAVNEYNERAGTLSVLKISVSNHEKAADRLADFRTAMAGSIRPELEELTSGFVQVLTDGRHEAVTLSDEFEITLLEGGIESEVISGGCEDIVALAQRLAISQMIAQRAGHPLSLMILDEPFGSLDDVRRGNVLNLLERLKGTFEQTVVVTHVDEVKDSVDNLMQCSFDPDEMRSYVTQEAGTA